MRNPIDCELMWFIIDITLISSKGDLGKKSPSSHPQDVENRLFRGWAQVGSSSNFDIVRKQMCLFF